MTQRPSNPTTPRPADRMSEDSLAEAISDRDWWNTVGAIIGCRVTGWNGQPDFNEILLGDPRGPAMITIPREAFAEWISQLDAATDESNDGMSYAVCLEMQQAMLDAAPPAPAVSPDVSDLIARLEKDADAWAATSDHDGGGDTYSGALMREAARALGSSAPVVDREAVARVIDPDAFGLPVGRRGPLTGRVTKARADEYNQVGALTKADAILALAAPPAHREADGPGVVAMLLSEIEALKRRVERRDDQIQVERRAYRNLLADYESRTAPPTPRAVILGEG